MTTVTTFTPLKPGDLVVSHDGTVYRLEKRNRVNWVATGDDGRRYNLRDTGRLRKAPEGTVFSGPAPKPPAVVTLGSIVKFDRGVVGRDRGLFVVVKNNYDSVNLAKLGGDHDRFWRSVLKDEIEKIELADLPSYLSYTR